ncbi:hypothetical protein [Kitasatospora indigofera]|uniref:hypothetical protein n=1 Tax=Kitasatospora indigofera TaxID=67307 RepID=UPI0036B97CBD
MSITTDERPPGPQEPAKEAAKVDLTKTQPGDEDQAEAADAEGDGEEGESWAARLKTRILAAFAEGGEVREHGIRARANTWAWVMAEQVTDGELAAEILTQRRQQHATRERELRRQVTETTAQIARAQVTGARAEALVKGEAGQRAEAPAQRDSAEVVALRVRHEQLVAELAEHAADAVRLETAPTAGEIGRARWGRRTFRASALVASVVGGGVLLPLQDLRWLLGALPAAAVALWRVGLPADDDGQAPAEAGAGAATSPQVPAQAVEQPLEGPAFAAAVTAARQAAEVASSPGAVAAREVAQAAEQAAQVQGSSDLVTALVKAGIIAKAEEDETKIVGVIRPDGPGWTATVELPAGKPAEVAISRAAELASALRVKSAQIQMSRDVTEDGHEGRFVIWVANTSNPYAGAPVPSELIRAESWDFWAQGIPLGTNARGVRKILSMLWSSLLIGGLMGFGKSYLARLIAAAAVLDPYVNIVLLSGKSGADWAALKVVAHAYVTGNSAGVIREMHEVMETLIADMQQHGQELEDLFEKDPKLCPEGKITPELAKSVKLGMTLLIVDELQEILDGAAGIKLTTSDEEAEDGVGRSQNGKPVMVSLFARFMRVARFVGGMAVIITQRPDSNSVPTELREVAAKRACFRVKGQNSSKMVLGDDAVKDGAAPHLLMDMHKGVAVVDEGAEDGHDTYKTDLINLDDFRVLCERGRALRLKAGTLSGQAARRWESEREGIQRRQIIADAVAAMDANGVDRARLAVLAPWMAELSPERWHDLTETTLAARLRDAGAGTTGRIGAVDGITKASGYLRETLQTVLDGRAA